MWFHVRRGAVPTWLTTSCKTLAPFSRLMIYLFTEYFWGKILSRLDYHACHFDSSSAYRHVNMSMPKFISPVNWRTFMTLSVARFELIIYSFLCRNRHVRHEKFDILSWRYQNGSVLIISLILPAIFYQYRENAICNIIFFDFSDRITEQYHLSYCIVTLTLKRNRNIFIILLLSYHHVTLAGDIFGR